MAIFTSEDACACAFPATEAAAVSASAARRVSVGIVTSSLYRSYPQHDMLAKESKAARRQGPHPPRRCRAIGEARMEDSIRKLFERYEEFFKQSLAGDIDMDAVKSLYASAFIAASPAGVMIGENDDKLKKAMAEGYAHYRAIGTKEMRIRNVRLTPIDEHHCVAHVAWTATYARQNQPDVAIDFDVHYLVQKLDGEPKIFGWVSGDEQALLRMHGIT
jgi:hypothetical protein